MKIHPRTKLVTVCCECRKVKIDGMWHEQSDVELGDALPSHGYCPECFEVAMSAVMLMFPSSKPAMAIAS